MVTLVSILGWTGTGPAPTIPDIHARIRPIIAERYPDGFDWDTDNTARRFFTDTFTRYLHAWFAAEAHNNAVPLANRYARLDLVTRTAVDQTNQLYADLSRNTTINWLAAHHRYVLATINARQLLTERADLAADLAKAKVSELTEGRSFSYDLYVEHVPADQRITFPDPDAVQLELTSFIETNTERFAILRATVTGGYPTGFEPAGPEPTPTAEHDEWSGRPWPTSDAVANTGRGW